MVLQALRPSLFEICPNWPLCKPQWIRISTGGSRKAESSKATTEKRVECWYKGWRERCSKCKDGELQRARHPTPSQAYQPDHQLEAHHDTLFKYIHMVGQQWTIHTWPSSAFKTCPNDPTIWEVFILGGRRIFLLRICPEMISMLCKIQWLVLNPCWHWAHSDVKRSSIYICFLSGGHQGNNSSSQ